MYYVTQTNSDTGQETLLGFNLNKEEKDNLFYSLGKNKEGAIGSSLTEDAHLSNAYGGHKKKFKNEAEAFIELIDKPKQFNDALEFLEKAGYDVVKKGVVNNKQKAVSYQMEKINIFG